VPLTSCIVLLSFTFIMSLGTTKYLMIRFYLLPPLWFDFLLFTIDNSKSYYIELINLTLISMLATWSGHALGGDSWPSRFSSWSRLHGVTHWPGCMTTKAAAVHPLCWIAGAPTRPGGASALHPAFSRQGVSHCMYHWSSPPCNIFPQIFITESHV
jgi:hypothetical protein